MFAGGIVALSRCLLLIMCGHFAEMGIMIWTTMKESKAQPPAEERKLLGARIGFVRYPEPLASIRPGPKRVTKIKAELHDCLSAARWPTSCAGSSTS